MLSILETSYEKNTPFKDKVTLLQSAANLELLCSPNPDLLTKILVKIKLFLDDGSTQFEGLLLLHAMLSQCSEQVFVENAMSWLQSVFQVIRGTGSSSSKEIACSTLKSIVTNLAYFPGLQRDVGEKLMKDIIITLITTSLEDQWISNVVQCLATVMKEMSCYCIPFKNDIEKFLVMQLDCSFNTEVEPIAECFNYLPYIGERSSNATNYADYWKEFVEKQIGSLNKILNFFFDEESGSLFPVSLPLPEEPEDEISAILYNSRRFQTIAKCLAKMLCSETKYIVEVPVSSCLHIIDRCSSVLFQNLNDDKKLRMRIGMILPVIHSSAMVILEALMITCHDFLILHEEAIGKLLIQKFLSQFMMTDNDTEDIQCSMLRVTIYRVLRLWIEKLHPVSLKLFHHTLRIEILKDIKPVSNTVKGGISSLRESRQVLKTRSRGFVKKSICNEALALLSSILHSANCSFTKDFIKILQETVVELLLQCQQGGQMPYPYSEDECRLTLYRIFLHMVVHNHLTNFSPLPVAIPIFHMGQRDRSLEVTRLCLEASSICMAIIHPEHIVHTHSEAAPTITPKISPSIPVDSRFIANSTSEWEVPIKNSPSHSIQVNSQIPTKPNIVVLKVNDDFDMSVETDHTGNRDQDSEDEYDIEDVEDENVEEEEKENEDYTSEVHDDEEMADDDDDDDDDDDEEGGQEMEDSSQEENKIESPVNDRLAENEAIQTNGKEVKAIKENGIELSDEESESQESIPDTLKKPAQLQPINTTITPVAAVKTASEENSEVQENFVGESSELEVDDMLQDFIPCSPDHALS